MSIEFIKGDDLEKKGLNLIWNVGKGSANTPNMTTLCYWGNPEKKDDVYGLVGKGVCFDCGGLSLKMSLMDKMYIDKGGACTAISIVNAVATLGLKINVVCTVGFVENSISSTCYRNSDIITSYKGLTVEVLNTDAEGRLVLADCLSY
jgi:leucyl aminopeptidase